MAYDTTTTLVFNVPYDQTPSLVFGDIGSVNYLGIVAADATFTPNPSADVTLRYGPNADLVADATFVPEATTTISLVGNCSPVIAATADFAPDPSAVVTATYKQNAYLHLVADATFSPSVEPNLTADYKSNSYLYLAADATFAPNPNANLTAEYKRNSYLYLATDATFAPVPSATITARCQANYTAALTATVDFVPAPSMTAVAAIYPQQTLSLEVTANFSPAPISTIKAIYNSSANRGVVGRFSAGYHGVSIQQQQTLGWLPKAAINQHTNYFVIDGYPVASQLANTYLDKPSPVQESLEVNFRHGLPTRNQLSTHFNRGHATPQTLRTIAVEPLRVRARVSATSPFANAIPCILATLWPAGKAVGQHQTFINSQASFVAGVLAAITHTHGKPLSPGHHRIIRALYVPDPEVHTGFSQIKFTCRYDNSTTLTFRNPPCDSLIIPIRRAYVVANTFSFVRADNGTPIYVSSFSISLDDTAWTWSWSAKVHGKQITDVLSSDPMAPIEALATINGTIFKLVIEKISRERSFGTDSLALSGRGTSAYLATPYAPITTLYSASAITAQQAAEQALMYNAVPIGWGVDWGLNDWLIAGGALSNTGTYIEHLQVLAAAGGGYLQPDLTADIMHFLPYYPTAPWEWSTTIPDLILPESVVTTESIDYFSKPLYNSVWITGGSNGGVADRIVIAGTAGDNPASTVTDNLATDSIMTRQRGLRILGDTGKQTAVTLKLPVLAETGIILPGAFVQYVVNAQNYRGMVRGTAVSYDVPKAWQTIKVETHEYI